MCAHPCVHTSTTFRIAVRWTQLRPPSPKQTVDGQAVRVSIRHPATREVSNRDEAALPADGHRGNAGRIALRSGGLQPTVTSGQEPPYDEVADSGRSMALSTRRRHWSLSL